MVKNAVSVIDDWSGGQDTKTPILKMGLNKSPNMRNFHCAGVGNRLVKRGGFAKVNSSAVESDNLDEYYSLRDVSTYTQISQGFKPNTSSTVTKIRLWLKKTGTPAGTDTLTLVIQTNSSGVPSGSAVTNGTSNTVDISDTLTTSYAWVEFTFATNPSLTAGTQYHLVLQGAFTISTSNYVQWGADNYDIVYANGSMSYYDDTTWITDNLYNACFEVYITNGSRGNDGVAVWDFASKNMLLGIFGTQLYKMDKNSVGTPNGNWSAIGGGSAWDSYTKLLLLCDGVDSTTTFTDEIGKTVTANGNAQIDTAQKKFGTASGLFDGTGDYLTLADSADWNFGAGDFTIDFWIRPNAIGSLQFLYEQELDGNNTIYISLLASGTLDFVSYVGGVLKGYYSNATVLSNGTWYHIAIVRNGTTGYLFVNGSKNNSSENTAFGSNTLPDLAVSLFIAAHNTGGSAFNV